jgi:hypothetical protein
MMQYRRFGRTELQMPVFSCGGMRYQYKWQDLPLSEIPAENQQNLEATIILRFFGSPTRSDFTQVKSSGLYLSDEGCTNG